MGAIFLPEFFGYARTWPEAGFCTLPYAGQFALREQDPRDNVASTAPKISNFFMNIRSVFALTFRLINEYSAKNCTTY